MQSNETALAVRGGGQIATSRPDREVATSATSAHAVEQVRARYVMAHQQPRTMETVRIKLKAECERWGFADSAWFDLRGQNRGQGFTIRFAEAAARAMGNLSKETFVIFEDDERVIVRVQVTDLESNTSETRDLLIQKTVERASSANRVLIGERKNSKGKTVFIVAATEDEMFTKISALTSKVRRQCILSMIPGDILDECADQIERTLSTQKEGFDPRAEVKRIADSFAKIGVLPDQLTRYLGQPIDQVATQGKIADLRNVYRGIESGEIAFADLLEEKEAARESTRENQQAARETVEFIEKHGRTATEEEIRAADAKRAEIRKAAAELAEKRGQVIDVPPEGSQGTLIDLPTSAPAPSGGGLKFAEFLEECEAAGLGTRKKIDAELVRVIGSSDQKKLTDHDRWLFIRWMQNDPSVTEDIAARKAQLGGVQ